MTMLGVSASYLRRGLFSGAARSPRLLSSTRLAPTLNRQSSAGMKVRTAVDIEGEGAVDDVMFGLACADDGCE